MLCPIDFTTMKKNNNEETPAQELKPTITLTKKYVLLNMKEGYKNKYQIQLSC